MYNLVDLAARLERMLQHGHVYIAVASALFALATFALDHEYVTKQRDLIYWSQLLSSYSQGRELLPISLLTMSLSIKMLLLSVVLMTHLCPRLRLGKYLERRRKRQYADFIVRRLIMQLELAMLHMPRKLQLDDPLSQPCYLRAKELAYRVVDEFRRDASRVLVKRSRLSNLDSPYFVLPDEEQSLRRAGYAHIQLRVSEELLSKLLYPQRPI